MAFSLRTKILSVMIMIILSVPVIAWAQTIDRVQSERPEMENDCKTEKVIAIYSKDCLHADCCISESAEKLSVADLLKSAIKCRDSDNFNICDNDTKETYIIYLRNWKCKLEKHLKDLDPLRKLKMRKEIISLDGRINDIQAVTKQQCLDISCKDCNTKELCRERCENNRERMEYWRNRYKNSMQGNQYLDCNACLEALENYYNEQKEMFFANKLNENLIYTPEYLNVMWGLLHCLSTSMDNKNKMNNTCLKNAKDILPHAMLPFLLPSWELLQLLEDKLEKGGLTPEEKRSLVEKRDQSIYIIKVLLELFNENGAISSWIPPADLAAILLGLIENNTASIQGINIKKRLEVFNIFLSTLSEKDLKNYLDSDPDYKKKLAEFIAAALQKADSTVLQMLKSLGFTNYELVNLINVQYEKYGEEEKAEFINSFIKIFDKEAIQGIDIKKRLEVFNIFLSTLSEKDLKNYLDSDPDYKKKLAEFIAAALQKADSTVLQMLKSLGFTNDMLVKLIKAQYEEDRDEEKKEFIRLLMLIFDEETMIINILFAERFFRIGDEGQKQILKEDKYREEIVRFVANLRAVKPELLDSNIPNPPLNTKYLTSFFMPGYVRSCLEKKPSGIVKAWNYSNIALLGLAVVSEAAYINTDYDNDTLFHTGVIATVAFIVNGVLGVVDAATLPKKKNDSAGIAITGPYISINKQDDAPALMFTFKY